MSTPQSRSEDIKRIKSLLEPYVVKDDITLMELHNEVLLGDTGCPQDTWNRVMATLNVLMDELHEHTTVGSVLRRLPQ